MDKLKELYTLICRTDFALNMEWLEYEDSEINFGVEGTQYSVLYLSGEIELKDSKFIMDCTLEMYSVDNDTTWKKEYPIENIGEIINDLSIAISRLADFNRQVDKYYEKFDGYKFPQSSAWKKEFVENLTHKFGGVWSRFTRHGVYLIISFAEDTNIISVRLSVGVLGTQEKVLYKGCVSEINYKEVLETVDTIYTEFKNSSRNIYNIEEELDELWR